MPKCIGCEARDERIRELEDALTEATNKLNSQLFAKFGDGLALELEDAAIYHDELNFLSSLMIQTTKVALHG